MNFIGTILMLMTMAVSCRAYNVTSLDKIKAHIDRKNFDAAIKEIEQVYGPNPSEPEVQTLLRDALAGAAGMSLQTIKKITSFNTVVNTKPKSDESGQPLNLQIRKLLHIANSLPLLTPVQLINLNRAIEINSMILVQQGDFLTYPESWYGKDITELRSLIASLNLKQFPEKEAYFEGGVLHLYRFLAYTRLFMDELLSILHSKITYDGIFKKSGKLISALANMTTDLWHFYRCVQFSYKRLSNFANKLQDSIKKALKIPQNIGYLITIPGDPRYYLLDSLSANRQLFSQRISRLILARDATSAATIVADPDFSKTPDNQVAEINETVEPVVADLNPNKKKTSRQSKRRQKFFKKIIDESRSDKDVSKTLSSEDNPFTPVANTVSEQRQNILISNQID